MSVKLKFSQVLFSGGSGGAFLQVMEDRTGAKKIQFKIILTELNPYVQQTGSNSICCDLTVEDLQNYRRYFDKAIELKENK